MSLKASEQAAAAEYFRLVTERVNHYLLQAESLFDTRWPVPSIDLKLRGLLAGKAHLQRWHLQFNPTLLRDNRDHFLRQTVGHEVAHLVVHATTRGRVKPHGIEWKRVMRAFGLDTRATHDYDVANLRRSRAPFVYRCGCCDDIRLGPVRHHRIGRGTRYYCRRCQTALTFSHRCT